MFRDADLLIWHNGLNYDLPVLEKIHPGFQTEARIRDTLVLSRLILSDLKDKDFELFRKGQLPGKLIGSHSLAAHGHRLGVLKGDYGKGDGTAGVETHDEDAWAEWTPEMEEYGIQDLHVTKALWDHLEYLILRKKYPEAPIILEHRFADLAARMEHNGYPFDVEKAEALNVVFQNKRQVLVDELLKQFKPWWEAAKWVKGKKWTEADVTTPNKTLNYKDVTKASRTEGASFCPVIMKTFNPSSRDHVADRLQRLYGWVPQSFTETGKAKVDEDVLTALSASDEDEDVEDELEVAAKSIPEAKLLTEYFTLQKRLGQLSEGKNAWLKLVRNGKVHGSMNTMGARSYRVSHSKPNLSQCPAVRSPYGYEMRDLWTTRVLGPDWVIVGTDLSGIEIRLLAEELAQYDDGAYIKVVVEGDVHTTNQQAFGVPTRDNAKTCLYGMVYGGGDSKIGSIVGGTAADGKRIKNNFMKAIPAYKKMVTTFNRTLERQGWLPGIDGRRMLVDSPHKVLNMRLQGAGAIVAKMWATSVEDKLLEKGMYHSWQGDFAFTGFYHDELAVVVRVPGFDINSYKDTNDYSAIQNDKKKVSSLKEKNRMDWILNSEPRLRVVHDSIKQSIKDVERDLNFRCPLDCEVKIGTSWAEVH